HAELVEDVADVAVDRAHADAEPLRDRAVGLAARDACEDLELPGREARRSARAAPGRAQAREVALRAQALERFARGGQLAVGSLVVAEGPESGREPDARPRGRVGGAELEPGRRRAPQVPRRGRGVAGGERHRAEAWSAIAHSVSVPMASAAATSSSAAALARSSRSSLSVAPAPPSRGTDASLAASAASTRAGRNRARLAASAVSAS